MTLHYRWLNDVSSMVGKISRNFKNLFSELKCAGDVSLHVPEREVSLNKHSLCVKNGLKCKILYVVLLPGRLRSVWHQDPRQVSRHRTSTRIVCPETQWWREVCLNRRLHDGSTGDDVMSVSMRRRNQPGITVMRTSRAIVLVLCNANTSLLWQGMDPSNERKIFDIIVHLSCKKMISQYFLLTPKVRSSQLFKQVLF